MHTLSKLAWLLACFFLSQFALTAQIVLQANGTVNQIDNTAYWNSSVAIGTPVSMTITLATGAPDGRFFDPRVGYYDGTGAPWSAQLAVGNYLFSSASTYLYVYDNYPSPFGSYGYQTGVGFGSLNQNGLRFAGFMWMMLANSPLPGLNSDALDIQELPVSAFSFRDFRFEGQDANNQTARLRFTPTSYSVQVVPEPGVMALLSIPVVLFICLRRPSARHKGD